jgi:hypothetical protein
VLCFVVWYYVNYQPKDEGRMVVEMWHYFTVVDTYTGLDRGFRWREAVCGYCGVDYQFQMYDGMCGRWIPVRSFLTWMTVLSIVVILILRNFIGLMVRGLFE